MILGGARIYLDDRVSENLGVSFTFLVFLMGIKMTTMFILALYDKNGGCDIKALQNGGYKRQFTQIEKNYPIFCLFSID